LASHAIISVSHKKLRTEKKCLNCGHAVEERFCSRCGQENLELTDSAMHLVIHYIQDLFHYDGKLWHTLRNLVLCPGLVAVEYREGKRQTHLEPIKFYVFASTVFFLAFFFIVGKAPPDIKPTTQNNYSKRLYHLNQEKNYLAGSSDTLYINELIGSLQQRLMDTTAVPEDSSSGDLEITLFNVPKDTQSDAGWLGNLLLERIESRTTELEKEHEGDEIKATSALLAEIIHTLPKLIFLSLPFFAFFLKILYWRSRKASYVEHFIFSVYHYAYLFAIMFLYILADWILDKADVTQLAPIKGWLIFGMVMYPFVYLLLSMKRFYSDRWGRLLVRYLALMVLFGVIILILFLLLAMVTLLF